jgi:hypothetical protein
LKDKSRISEQDWPKVELEKLVWRLMKLMKDNQIPSSCRIKTYDATNPPPKVSYFICLVQGGGRITGYIQSIDATPREEPAPSSAPIDSNLLDLAMVVIL